MQITQNAKLRRGLRFMVHPAPYEISAQHGAIHTANEFGQPVQPVCRMAACNGRSSEVAQRIVTLLNSYGLVPNDTDLAVTAGRYEVWCLQGDHVEGEAWVLGDTLVRDSEFETLAEARARATRLRENWAPIDDVVTGQRVQIRLVALLEDK